MVPVDGGLNLSHRIDRNCPAVLQSSILLPITAVRTTSASFEMYGDNSSPILSMMTAHRLSPHIAAPTDNS